jgi:predicted nucleic acid-binding protein
VIVVDAASIHDTLLDQGSRGAQVRAILRQDLDVHLPDIVDLEVVSSIQRRFLRGELSVAVCDAALADLSALPYPRHASRRFVRRAFELRHTLTPYDAVYVALAEEFGCELVTADARLARAPGIRCPVRLITA